MLCTLQAHSWETLNTRWLVIHILSVKIQKAGWAGQKRGQLLCCGALTFVQVVVFPLPWSPTNMMMLLRPLVGCQAFTPGSISCSRDKISDRRCSGIQITGQCLLLYHYHCISHKQQQKGEASVNTVKIWKVFKSFFFPPVLLKLGEALRVTCQQTAFKNKKEKKGKNKISLLRQEM